MKEIIKKQILRVKEKIEIIKKGVTKLKENIRNQKTEKKKIGARPYFLLAGMVVICAVSLALNGYKYFSINQEGYKEYVIKDNVTQTLSKVSEQLINEGVLQTEQQVQYATAESSINILSERIQINNTIPNWEIIQDYSKDNLVYYAGVDMWQIHLGVDIVFGTQQVVAFKEGIVTKVYKDACWGHTVVIDSKGHSLVYSNLTENILVSVGEKISSGEIIGYMGQSSEYEKHMPPHLHLEYIVNGKNENPVQSGIN